MNGLCTIARTYGTPASVTLGTEKTGVERSDAGVRNALLGAMLGSVAVVAVVATSNDSDGRAYARSGSGGTGSASPRSYEPYNESNPDDLRSVPAVVGTPLSR